MKSPKKFRIAFFIVIFLLLLLFLSTPTVLAHEDEDRTQDEYANLIETDGGMEWSNPINYVVFSGAWVVILTLFLLIMGRGLLSRKTVKKIFFLVMVIPIVLTTLYLAGHTIYENINSPTGGPVHWHADYQVWMCGERLDLKDPKFPRNKIGTPLLHEHDDDRIHVEGTPKDLEEASLSFYFRTIGGELEAGHLKYPTNDGKYLEMEEGDSCKNGGQDSLKKLKVYVNGERTENYEDYIIYPDPNVPPGDCIIIIFDSNDEPETNILCESWEVNGWGYDDFTRREVTIKEKTWP